MRCIAGYDATNLTRKRTYIAPTCYPNEARHLRSDGEHAFSNTRHTDVPAQTLLLILELSVRAMIVSVGILLRCGAFLSGRFSDVKFASPELRGIVQLVCLCPVCMESSETDTMRTFACTFFLPAPRRRFRSARQWTIASESALSVELPNWHFAFAVEVRHLDGHGHAGGGCNPMGYDASDWIRSHSRTRGRTYASVSKS